MPDDLGENGHEERGSANERGEAGAPDAAEMDSAGVYYMSIEDFERRRAPAPPPPRSSDAGGEIEGEAS